MELTKIRKRRVKLYEDLYRSFGQNIPTEKFQPQIELNENDKIHLRQLLSELSKMDRNELLKLLRQIARIIEQSVQYAFSMVARPLVPISSDLACKKQMELLISNPCDAEILVDALCWAEKNRTTSLMFCTIDYTDILRKRQQIYGEICKIRAYDPQELPLEIASLDELIA